MRFRAPLLYEQYIGQYLTQEELSARTPAHRPPTPGPPGTPTCPLSDLLLQSYQERELQQRLLQQQEEEEACLEEDEEEEDEDEEGEGRQPGGPSVHTPSPGPCASAPWRHHLQEQTACPPLPALSAPALPSSSIPVPLLEGHPSPPGLRSCCSLRLEGPPLTALLRVSGLHPVLWPPEHCVVTGLMYALGR